MDKATFLNTYGPVADRVGKELGVDPSIIKAQWALETGWGKSIIPGSNNLGNIKKGKSWTGPTVRERDNQTGSNDEYRAYTSPEASGDDYRDTIRRMYPKAVGQGTASGFLAAIKGYAEDVDYDTKVMDIAKSINGMRPTVRSVDNAIAAGPTPEQFKNLTDRYIQSMLTRPSDAKRYSHAIEEASTDAALREEARPDLLDSLSAGMAGNSDQWVANLAKHTFGTGYKPEEGYKPEYDKAPPGSDSDLLEAMARSKSSVETTKILADYHAEQERTRTVFDGGTASGMLVAMATEVPTLTNVVTGGLAALAFARKGYGAVQLARQGRNIGAVGSAIGENVLAGSGFELFRQAVDHKLDAKDMLVNLAADTVFGAVAGGFAVRSGQILHMQDVAAKAKLEFLAREEGLIDKAKAELGDGATAEAVAAKVEELRYAPDVQVLVDSVSPAKAVGKPLDVANHIEEEVTPIAPEAPTAETPLAASDIPAIEVDFPTMNSLNQRRALYAPGGSEAGKIAEYSGGRVADLAAFEKLGGGVHVWGDVPVGYEKAISAINRLSKLFLGDGYTIGVAFRAAGVERGAARQISTRGAIISLAPDADAGTMLRTAVHEVGHVVFNSHLAKASPEQWARLTTAFQEFVQAATRGDDGNKARAIRWSETSDWQLPQQRTTAKVSEDYAFDMDEFAAEQFVKFAEKHTDKLGLTPTVVKMLKDAVAAAKAFLKIAKREGIPVDANWETFFTDIMNKQSPDSAPAVDLKRPTLSLKRQAPIAQEARPASMMADLLADPDYVRFGLNTLPADSPKQREKVRAMLALHKQAEAWAIQHPKDAAWDARAKNLIDNEFFNLASTSMIMLKSESPLTRMIASQLLEDTSNIKGTRNPTAAIAKYTLERTIQGNVTNDFTGAYSLWEATQTTAMGSIHDALIGGRLREQFNRMVMAEIESRGNGSPVPGLDTNVKAAADVVEAAFKRSASVQRRYGTLGAEAMGTGVGYATHRMNPQAVFNLTNEQATILHQVLVGQFESIEGWDKAFSTMLASKYMETVRKRASGDFSSTIGGNSASSLDTLREVLHGLGHPDDVVNTYMASFTKGAANFTKKRLNLDLNAVYQTPSGEFRLMDVFDTNVVELVRAQARRVSGEAALTQFGVKGKPGMQLLREAMRTGETGHKASDADLGAFDQVAAEFFGEPFGTQMHKGLERVVHANAAIRLGGAVWNQLSESFNAVWAVGAGRALEAVGMIPQMRKEILALARGEVVDNPIIGSIELAGGAEFGLDSYKHVMPFDDPSAQYPTYGRDTITLADKLIRGAGHLQGKLSFWRAVHSAQQRGIAMQVTHKAMSYIKSGAEDKALRDFGITADLQARMRAELANPGVATFAANGKLLDLDITKVQDADTREAFIQSIWRGTHQIIQQTHIGEQGKWVHDGWMRALTQFKGFGIVSVEKQWGRQRNMHGTFGAFGIALGSLGMGAPVYMARMYAQSAGREDREEYLQKRLSPEAIARGSLNYVATLGMAGDFVDALTIMAPDRMGLTPNGGRAGVPTDFVGSMVLPASSLVDDAWHYVQDPTDIKTLKSLLPLGRVPTIVPFLNALPDGK